MFLPTIDGEKKTELLMVTEDIGFKPSTEIGAEIWNCKACSVADLASFFVFFGGVFSQVLC